MNELLTIPVHVEVQDSEYKRLLGYPQDYEVDDRVKALMDQTRRWYSENGKPWIYARRSEALAVTDKSVRIDDADFYSPRLRSQLAQAKAHSVMLLAASAGKSCEERARQLWKEEKPDEYFFMEVYGSAVVEHLVTHAGAQFCEWADTKGMAILPHYSPGYPGWDISEQGRLLTLITHKKKDSFPEEIRVLETGMLFPKKSLLAVFGITSHIGEVKRLTSLIPCENCSFQPCRYRRLPYRNSPPQIEDVRNLQSEISVESVTKRSGKNPLARDANYRTNVRALQKWSEERLRLRMLDDRSVEARFRYEGKTCSNMGHVLEFDYHITLRPAHEGYRIVEARCAPAPEDIGHKLMCQYLEDPKPFMKTIDRERPMVGKLLNDILTWSREYSPSGCYCSSNSRDYKWGIVYEVIHFALAHDMPLS